MSETPFEREPGYEYLQGKQAVGIKSHELEWWHNAFQAWEELHGPIAIPRWSNEWFRRKLPAPQPSITDGGIEFTGWDAHKYCLLKGAFAVLNGHHIWCAHDSCTGFFADRRYRFYPAPPPEPTQEEKDREAAEAEYKQCGARWHREAYIAGCIAGIQHGRKSK